MDMEVKLNFPSQDRKKQTINVPADKDYITIVYMCHNTDL